MFSIIVLQTLTTLVLTASYPVGNVIVDVTLVSNGPVMIDPASPNANKCGSLIARNSQVYHLSTENTFQSSFKGSLGNIHNDFPPVLSVQSIPTLDVTRAENTIIFKSDAPTENAIIWDIKPASKLIAYLKNFTINLIPWVFQKNSNTIAVLSYSGTGSQI